MSLVTVNMYSFHFWPFGFMLQPAGDLNKTISFEWADPASKVRVGGNFSNIWWSNLIRGSLL